MWRNRTMKGKQEKLRLFKLPKPKRLIESRREKTVIDYEFKIRQLEADIEHYRTLQQLHRQRMDAFEGSIDIVKTAMDTAASNIQATSAQLLELAVTVHQLSQNVDKLVKTLLREHPNGKGQDESDA